MLHLAIALLCEAKPFISHFRLKRDLSSSSFTVYRNQEIFLIISGIGKVNAAAATSYLFQYTGEV